MKAVLLSGGVDSTTCLALAKQSGDAVAISFSYGQSHSNYELEAARKISAYYEVEHHIIDLESLFAQSKSSLNARNHLEPTPGDYANQKEANTEVEFRNGVFLAIMASLAMQYGADTIYYGAHRDDSGVIYPDCSPAFIKAMTEAVEVGTGGKVTVEAPFKDLRKSDIVALGLELGVPYEQTYSCYAGTMPVCGKCGTCIDRAKAFLANGVEDPLNEKLFDNVTIS